VWFVTYDPRRAARVADLGARTQELIDRAFA
jgi:hypothetical protein